MSRPFCPKTRPSGQRCVLMNFGAYPLIGMRGCNGTLRLISVHFSILDWIRRRDSLEMREWNVSTAISTFGGRYARELFWCYSWLCRPSWSFLYMKFSISCIFHKSIIYRRTNGPTDGRTDMTSYRDARTHLKTTKRPTDWSERQWPSE